MLEVKIGTIDEKVLAERESRGRHDVKPASLPQCSLPQE